MRTRQMKVKVHENLLFTSGCDLRASLSPECARGMFGDALCHGRIKFLVLRLRAAKFNHPGHWVSFFSHDKQQDCKIKLCKLVVYF